MRVAFHIVVLVVAYRPYKSGQGAKAQKQRTGDEYDENVHSYLARRALRVTVIELVDIARAAIKGEAKPQTARGIATML